MGEAGFEGVACVVADCGGCGGCEGSDLAPDGVVGEFVFGTVES